MTYKDRPRALHAGSDLVLQQVAHDTFNLLVMLYFYSSLPALRNKAFRSINKINLGHVSNVVEAKQKCNLTLT